MAARPDQAKTDHGARGYHPDAIPPELADALASARSRLGGLGEPFFYFTSVGSTNDVAAALAESGHAGEAVVVAEAQSAGRGRRGRTWFSPPGSGLYVSVLLNLGGLAVDPARATSLLTLAAGVGLAEAVEAATGLQTEIKWPNDLLVHRRKVAGILAEGVSGPAGRLTAVVLGYGINVGPMNYPPEIAARAASLEIELGRPLDRAVLCVETLAALASRRADLAAGRFDAILAAWRDRSPGSTGARVSWQSATGQQTGITQGIDDQGALLVRTGDRTERLLAGEVIWKEP